MGKNRKQKSSLRDTFAWMFGPTESDPNRDLKRLMDEAYYLRWMHQKTEANKVMDMVCRALERRSYNPNDYACQTEDDDVIETITPTQTTAKSSEEAAYEYAVIHQFDRTR